MPLTNVPLYYGAGSPLNSERCVDITIIDDDFIEPDQSFEVSLSTSDPVFLTPIDQADVIIATDNDSEEINVLYSVQREHCMGRDREIVFIITDKCISNLHLPSQLLLSHWKKQSTWSMKVIHM